MRTQQKPEAEMTFDNSNVSRSNTLKSRGANVTDDASYLDHVPESEQESEFMRVEDDSQSMGSEMHRVRSNTQGTDTEMIRGRSGTEMSFNSETEINRKGTEMIRGRSGTEMGRVNEEEDEVERLS